MNVSRTLKNNIIAWIVILLIQKQFKQIFLRIDFTQEYSLIFGSDATSCAFLLDL